jgi:hypothetical protein
LTFDINTSFHTNTSVADISTVDIVAKRDELVKGGAGWDTDKRIHAGATCTFPRSAHRQKTSGYRIDTGWIEDG